MNNTVKYISVEEASRITKIPVTRIVSLIVQNQINGIIVNGETGVLQETELEYLK